MTKEEVLLDAYRKLLASAFELLAENGWRPFGYHMDQDPVPDLEFWGSDEGRLPFFERVKTSAGE